MARTAIPLAFQVAENWAASEFTLLAYLSFQLMHRCTRLIFHSLCAPEALPPPTGEAGGVSNTG